MRPRERHALERLAGRRLPRNWAATHEVTRELSRASRAMNRRLGMLIDRGGRVAFVCLGDAHRIEIPDVTFERVSASRLRGLRFVHTHLDKAEIDSVDLVELARFRLDLTLQVHVGEDGEPLAFSLAHLTPEAVAIAGESTPESAPPWRVEPPRAIHGLPGDFDRFIEALEDEYQSKAAGQGAGRSSNRPERALLVGVEINGGARDLHARMAELAELARSAGVDVRDTVVQRRNRFDPRYLVGKGKLDEIVMKSLRHQTTVLIFDRDLTPAQAKNISSRVDLKIIDRTQLILDIFAQRAHSSDGKLQVELARLRYLLPHLVGGGRSLSRIRGGIGGNRGVGEQKLELDRRRYRDRISALERQIERLSQRRQLNRRARMSGPPALVSLVGYTNAGKSSWMRSLSGAEVEIADLMFATLDPTSRKVKLPDGAACVISDTVGFLRDLPADLVAAFRATLDELSDADLLVHVADAADPQVMEHVRAVRGILGELGLAGIPRLLVLNKIDLLEPQALALLAAEEPEAMLASAAQPEDRERVLAAIAVRLSGIALAASEEASAVYPAVSTSPR